jgi:hypothetical protein
LQHLTLSSGNFAAAVAATAVDGSSSGTAANPISIDMSRAEQCQQHHAMGPDAAGLAIVCSSPEMAAHPPGLFNNYLTGPQGTTLPPGVGMGLVLGPIRPDDNSHNAFAAAAAATATATATTAEQHRHSEGLTPRGGSNSGKRRSRGVHIEDAVKTEQQPEAEFGLDFSCGALNGLQGVFREAHLAAAAAVGGMSGFSGIDEQHQQLLQSMSAFAAEEESSQSPSKRVKAAASALAAMDSDFEDPMGGWVASFRMSVSMAELRFQAVTNPKPS